MFLNSVILGNILNHEKCELKNSIDVYMDSKIIKIINNDTYSFTFLFVE
jgi:hypothetical protein